MVLRIKNYRERCRKMDEFFSSKEKFINPYNYIVEKISVFHSKLQLFDDYAVSQQMPIKGFAKKKKKALEKAAGMTSKWSRLCHVKAFDDGNFVLEGLLNHTISDIMKLDDIKGLNLMKN